MSVFRTDVICAAMILILAACAQDSKTIIPEKTNKATAFLNAGIKYYEEGKYNPAEKNLKEALKLDMLDTTEQVTAHKYLAFIYSVSKRKTLCQKAFEKAFELDPNFTLSSSEAGHPMWGPIYRSVKAKFNPDKTSR